MRLVSSPIHKAKILHLGFTSKRRRSPLQFVQAPLLSFFDRGFKFRVAHLNSSGGGDSASTRLRSKGVRSRRIGSKGSLQIHTESRKISIEVKHLVL